MKSVYSIAPSSLAGRVLYGAFSVLASLCVSLTLIRILHIHMAPVFTSEVGLANAIVAIVTIVVVPFYETGLGTLLIFGLQKRLRSPILVTAISAATWSSLHWPLFPRALLALFPFLLFSIGIQAYLRKSWLDAILSVWSIHALYNVGAVFLLPRIAG
jgi:hypothetical protein